MPSGFEIARAFPDKQGRKTAFFRWKLGICSYPVLRLFAPRSAVTGARDLNKLKNHKAEGAEARLIGFCREIHVPRQRAEMLKRPGAS
jgi:hypothetical protein